jgi:hypothetical protein
MLLTVQTSNSHVISGLRLEIVENRALLGHYAVSSGNSLPTFLDNLSGPILRGQGILDP